jgi:hypothetical protein
MEVEMKVRLVITSNSTGTREAVTFMDADNTEDFFPAEGMTVDFDEIIEADLPTSFPMDYTLIRRS